MTRLIIAAIVAAAAVAAPESARAQVEIDRTLSTFSGQAVTTGDVRRARVLKLMPVTTSDEAIQTALENRRLMLLEIARIPQPDPTAAEKAAQRRIWEERLGAGANVAALLAQAGMSAAMLETWMAEEARIDKYQAQRFGSASEPAAAVNTWIQGLRRKAGLPVR
jgi:hypothetical protein